MLVLNALHDDLPRKPPQQSLSALQWLLPRPLNAFREKLPLMPRGMARGLPFPQPGLLCGDKPGII